MQFVYFIPNFITILEIHFGDRWTVITALRYHDQQHFCNNGRMSTLNKFYLSASRPL